jgi:hypothetical protein|tara:strand:+ start:100 stop:279 length:180 start_codon:yes stop_codon:yes gene_type:complete
MEDQQLSVVEQVDLEVVVDQVMANLFQTLVIMEQVEQEILRQLILLKVMLEEMLVLLTL